MYVFINVFQIAFIMILKIYEDRAKPKSEKTFKYLNLKANFYNKGVPVQN